MSVTERRDSIRKVIALAGSSFLVGAALSAAILWVMYVGPARRDVADLYVIGVERNIAANELILIGKTNEAMRLLENDMLVTVAGIEDAFSDHPGADYFLWQIWDYFDSNNITPTGRFRHNLSGIDTNYPSSAGPTIYYYESHPSYVQSIMPTRASGGPSE